MTKEELAKRNAEIYDAYCAGARHKQQGIDRNLAETYIKQICMNERRRRGLVKQKGVRQ